MKTVKIEMVVMMKSKDVGTDFHLNVMELATAYSKTTNISNYQVLAALELAKALVIDHMKDAQGSKFSKN
jgi:hypothetical protein